VRYAFVVSKNGSGESKGFGYVSFSIKEDAQTAFDTVSTEGIEINGRKLRVKWADKKMVGFVVVYLWRGFLWVWYRTRGNLKARRNALERRSLEARRSTLERRRNAKGSIRR
jgi:RNA recognition motif-containing protein